MIYSRFAVRKVLVIAPKRVAETTWTTEASKWDHLQHVKVVKVIGTQQQRIRALCTPADVYVINRENVPWLVEYEAHNWMFDMVVIDELSSFKSHRAQRFKSLKCIRGRISRIVGLTGTPASNGLIDLWAQIYLLDGGLRLGKTIGAFRDQFFSANAHGGHFTTFEAHDDADATIKSLIGDICVSMKADDYLQLPDCLVVDTPVQLDKTAERKYKDMEREMLLQIDGDTIDAGTAAVLTGKLLQIANGAVYNADKQVIPIHDCKLDAFAETLEALNGQHALVFYGYQHDKDRLLRALAKTPLRVRAYSKPQDADDWNDGKIDVLLAHPASVGYGLNLQRGGHHIIWFGLTWSLEQYMQANKRLHRQGQTEPVIIHRLIAQGTRDVDVAAALEGKADVQQAIMDALKARIREIKEEHNGH